MVSVTSHMSLVDLHFMQVVGFGWPIHSRFKIASWIETTPLMLTSRCSTTDVITFVALHAGQVAFAVNCNSLLWSNGIWAPSARLHDQWLVAYNGVLRFYLRRCMTRFRPSHGTFTTWSITSPRSLYRAAHPPLGSASTFCHTISRTLSTSPSHSIASRSWLCDGARWFPPVCASHTSSIISHVST